MALDKIPLQRNLYRLLDQTPRPRTLGRCRSPRALAAASPRGADVARHRRATPRVPAVTEHNTTSTARVRARALWCRGAEGRRFVPPTRTLAGETLGGAVRDYLTEIEDDLVSDVPLATILRKCIVMNGYVDSPKLRAWAEQELNGYFGEEDEAVAPPDYRTRGASLRVDAFVGNGQITGQSIANWELPEFAREHVHESFTFRQGAGELEALLDRGNDSIKFAVPNFHIVARKMDEHSGNPLQRITAMYWQVSTSTVAAILDETRTALAQVVAELRRSLGPSDTLPSSDATDRAVSVIVHGEQNTVTVSDASGPAASPQVVVADTAGTVQSRPAATIGDGQPVTGDAKRIRQDRSVTLRERLSGWSRAKQVGAAFAGLASVAGLGIAIWQIL